MMMRQSDFRSRAEWRAAWLFTTLDIEWEYESQGYLLQDTGETYVPDFWLPRLGQFIEVKSGERAERLHKPVAFARQLREDWLARHHVPQTVWDERFQIEVEAGAPEDSWWWNRPYLRVAILWDRHMYDIGCAGRDEIRDPRTWCDGGLEWTLCHHCCTWNLADLCGQWQCRACGIEGKCTVQGPWFSHHDAWPLTDTVTDRDCFRRYAREKVRRVTARRTPCPDCLPPLPAPATVDFAALLAAAAA